MDRRGLATLALALLLAMCYAPPHISISRAGSDTVPYHTLHGTRALHIVDAAGGGDFLTITAAIAAAAPMDSIEVWPGTYAENVVVDKTLEIYGTDRDTVIVDGGAVSSAISVTASHCTISYLTVQNFGNDVVDAGVFTASSNNIISHITVAGPGRQGIRVAGAITDNIVEYCHASGVTRNGLTLSGAQARMIIRHNTMTANGHAGIFIFGPALSHIYNNTIHTNTENGINIFSGTTDTIVENNTIYGNSHNGIRLYQTTGNIVRNNTIYNHMTATRAGINLDSGGTGANNNTIHHNNFISNTIHTEDSGVDNVFDMGDPATGGQGGNYYDDYAGADRGDGIGDVPRATAGTAGTADNYPWMFGNGWDILPVVDVAEAIIDIDEGETATLEAVTVQGYPVNWTWEINHTTPPTVLYGRVHTQTFPEPGNYTANFTAMDNFGRLATGNLTIVVRVADITAPVARTPPDVTVVAGESVQFDATASSDNVGIVSYTWTFTYGGAAITLVGATPSFTFDLAGTYAITLTVADRAGNTGTALMSVTVLPLGMPPYPPEEDELPPPFPEPPEEPPFSGEQLFGISVWLFLIFLIALGIARRR